MKDWLLLPSADKIQDTIWLMIFITFLATVLILTAKLLKLKPKRIQGKGGTVIDFESENSAPVAEKIAEAVPSVAEWPSLLHHRFFKLMARAETPQFFYCGEDSPKNRINEAFLHLKFTTFREGITEFTKQLELNNGANISRLPEVIVDLIREYERKSQTLRITLPDGTVICGVPKCYIVKFSRWHAPHASMALDNIADVLSDRIYPDWQSRHTSNLDYLHMAFQLTIEDGLLTLPQLNGDLEDEIASMVCND